METQDSEVWRRRGRGLGGGGVGLFALRDLDSMMDKAMGDGGIEMIYKYGTPGIC